MTISDQFFLQNSLLDPKFRPTISQIQNNHLLNQPNYKNSKSHKQKQHICIDNNPTQNPRNQNRKEGIEFRPEWRQEAGKWPESSWALPTRQGTGFPRHRRPPWPPRRRISSPSQTAPPALSPFLIPSLFTQTSQNQYQKPQNFFSTQQTIKSPPKQRTIGA